MNFGSKFLFSHFIHGKIYNIDEEIFNSNQQSFRDCKRCKTKESLVFLMRVRSMSK